MNKGSAARKGGEFIDTSSLTSLAGHVLQEKPSEAPDRLSGRLPNVTFNKIR
jgi:hypothetical protein